MAGGRVDSVLWLRRQLSRARRRPYDGCRERLRGRRAPHRRGVRPDEVSLRLRLPARSRRRKRLHALGRRSRRRRHRSERRRDRQLERRRAEASLPDWSSDVTALEAHVSAYFASFGVASCQTANAQEFDGAGRTISLPRSVNGIPVSESEAYARFDNQDQTTSESFYWPTISADVVTAARALHDRLGDPIQLAAYKAKLPADAQGDGGVVIHHTGSSSTTPFAAAATYDVVMTVGLLGMPAALSFDADGNPVSNAW